MEKHLGSKIEVVFRDGRIAIGVVDEIDVKTQCMTLSSVTVCTLDNPNEGVGYDKVIVNAPDISKLQILEDAPKIADREKEDKAIQKSWKSIDRLSIGGRKDPSKEKVALKKMDSKQSISYTFEELREMYYKTADKPLGVSSKMEKIMSKPVDTATIPKNFIKQNKTIKQNSPEYERKETDDYLRRNRVCNMKYMRVKDGKGMFPIMNSFELSHIVKHITVHYGPNTIQMIENSAVSTVSLISNQYKSLFGAESSIAYIVICVGIHRVGGIAIAVARHLANKGLNVLVLLADFSESQMKDSEKKYFRFQMNIANNQGIKIMELSSFGKDFLMNNKVSLVIDALSPFDLSAVVPIDKKCQETLKNMSADLISLNSLSPIFKELEMVPQIIVSFLFPSYGIKNSLESMETKDLPRVFMVDMGVSAKIIEKLNIENSKLFVRSLPGMFINKPFAELIYNFE